MDWEKEQQSGRWLISPLIQQTFIQHLLCIRCIKTVSSFCVILGPPRSKLQNRIRHARNGLRDMPTEGEGGRSRVQWGEPSDGDTGLTSVKRKWESSRLMGSWQKASTGPTESLPSQGCPLEESIWGRNGPLQSPEHAGWLKPYWKRCGCRSGSKRQHLEAVHICHSRCF